MPEGFNNLEKIKANCIKQLAFVSYLYIITNFGYSQENIPNNNVEDIIHNVIWSKIVIRRFFKYFRRKYRWRVKYWQNFDVLKDFCLVKKKDIG